MHVDTDSTISSLLEARVRRPRDGRVCRSRSRRPLPAPAIQQDTPRSRRRREEKSPCLQLGQGICTSIDSNCSSKSPAEDSWIQIGERCRCHQGTGGPKAKLASFQRDLLAKLPRWSQDHPAHPGSRSMSRWIRQLRG